MLKTTVLNTLLMMTMMLDVENSKNYLIVWRQSLLCGRASRVEQFNRQQFVTLTVYTLSSADSNRTFLNLCFND